MSLLDNRRTEATRVRAPLRLVPLVEHAARPRLTVEQAIEYVVVVFLGAAAGIVAVELVSRWLS